ncbi:hypothetical protein RCZ04_03090 [Capnocytophaga sp. HP1101]
MKPHILHITFDTSIEEALLLFEAHSVSALPVCESSSFIGVLNKETVEQAPKEDLVGDYRYALEYYSVPLTAMWDTVIESFALYQTDMLPVIDENQQFIGYYSLNDFLKQLSKTPFIQETGRVVVLQKDAHSYSFTEISRIVEENAGILLGLYLSNRTEGYVHITLKLLTEHLSDILQDFRRYGYVILTEKDDDHYRQELKDISDYFERYLDI